MFNYELCVMNYESKTEVDVDRVDTYRISHDQFNRFSLDPGKVVGCIGG